MQTTVLTDLKKTGQALDIDYRSIADLLVDDSRIEECAGFNIYDSNRI